MSRKRDPQSNNKQRPHPLQRFQTNKNPPRIPRRKLQNFSPRNMFLPLHLIRRDKLNS